MRLVRAGSEFWQAHSLMGAAVSSTISFMRSNSRNGRTPNVTESTGTLEAERQVGVQECTYVAGASVLQPTNSKLWDDLSTDSNGRPDCDRPHDGDWRPVQVEALDQPGCNHDSGPSSSSRQSSGNAPPTKRNRWDEVYKNRVAVSIHLAMAEFHTTQAELLALDAGCPFDAFVEKCMKAGSPITSNRETWKRVRDLFTERKDPMQKFDLWNGRGRQAAKKSATEYHEKSLALVESEEQQPWGQYIKTTTEAPMPEAERETSKKKRAAKPEKKNWEKRDNTKRMPYTIDPDKKNSRWEAQEKDARWSTRDSIIRFPASVRGTMKRRQSGWSTRTRLLLPGCTDALTSDAVLWHMQNWTFSATAAGSAVRRTCKTRPSHLVSMEGPTGKAWAGGRQL